MLMASALSPSLWGVQPLRKPLYHKQSDGTVLTVYKQGNGHFRYLTTTDGWALSANADGDLCYAEYAATGLNASSVLAHDPESRNSAEARFARLSAMSSVECSEHLSAKMDAPSFRALSGKASTDDGLGKYGQNGGGVVSSIGSPLIPVIMVEFPDRSFMPGTTPAKLNRLFNEHGYSDEPGSCGSVADYFSAQSNGLFTPGFEVVAKVTAAHGYAYYGANSSNTTDVRARELIKEAVAAAVSQGIDFSKFSENGEVPLVSIFYAGPGEHSAYEDGYEDYLWAHFNTISSLNAGGVPIRSYFIGNEVLQDYAVEDYNYVVTGEDLDGIGVFCHEFSHALGLPDFYATNGSDNCHTPDYWSVMDYGQYWQNGYAPIGYNAYERSFLGWLDVQELGDTPDYKELYPFGTGVGTEAYCLRNPSNASEYFLLENRQPDTWFPAAIGHGMLITHVDYNASLWSSNRLNNDNSHLRFSVVPADGAWQSSSTMKDAAEYWGDLYPGVTSNTSFTDNSVPASDVFVGTGLNKPLYNIAESEEGIVSFSYLDASVTGIAAPAASKRDSGVRVYALDGRELLSGKRWEELRERLAPGIYVVNENGKSRKVNVQ